MVSITLSELAERVKQVVSMSFDAPVWLRAEVAELRENANGHCYLEFIEKDSNSDNVVARMKATIWSTSWRMLKPYFESVTGQSIRVGMNLLVAVSVEFQQLYGLSLNVRDIDPAFTVGELAARRVQIIRQLEADGVLDMNRSLPFPERPQRIAVISSATAAGYEDFCNQLNSEISGYAFYTHLFPSIMQGEQAESSIIASLEKIYENADLFDVVVIIRGGGASIDLSCFDSYNLALNCAQFPLPVITGIGHQRDTTVLDLVANTSVKTPTAAAALLTEKMQETESKVLSVAENIFSLINEKIAIENRKIYNFKWQIKSQLSSKINRKHLLLQRQVGTLKVVTKSIIQYRQNWLNLIGKSIESHSPAFLLKHGYSISTVAGKRITSVKQITTGNIIRTYVHDGDFESEVIKKNGNLKI
jgi:exodeoxyribonuclease VII large subunit